MDDDRLIYTRWEYADKGLGNAETIWAMRPDGSGSDHVYKLNTVWPAGMSCARSIPGNQRIVTVAGNHYMPGMGPVVLVDRRTCNDTHTDADVLLQPSLARLFDAGG